MMTLSVVSNVNNFDTMKSPPISAIILISDDPINKYKCRNVFKTSYETLTTRRPRNVIGPINAVETDISTATMINNRLTTYSYGTPKLIACSFPSDSTSKYL